MNEIKLMRICDCCGYLMTLSDDNLNVCESCGTEYLDNERILWVS